MPERVPAARDVAAALRERGYVVLVTREPGGTSLGEAIRDVLLDPRYHGMSARAEALLYAAARAHLVEQVIRPALADGPVVLGDLGEEPQFDL